MNEPAKSTCETCQHWRRYTTDDDWSYFADGKANPDDFGECQAVTFDYWQSKGDNPFYVMDGSNYQAVLTTRRDFACNQHTPMTTSAPAAQ